MFFKKKEVESNDEKRYRFALSSISRYLEKIMEPQEKVPYLKLLRTSIIDEIASEYNNKILYSGVFKSNEHKASFVFVYYNSSGEEYFDLIDESFNCDLNKNKIVSYPWNIDRYLNAHRVISNYSFEYHNTNHQIAYYPQLDLYIAENGLHSIGAGVASKNGNLPCYIAYDITKMFENISSENGSFWLDLTDPASKVEIPDFRFALLFEISKLIWNLESEL